MNDKLLSAITAVSIMLLIALLLGINKPHTVTYKKSSDSEWEISPKQMPDTTITDTVVISGQIATPTVQYINIKLK